MADACRALRPQRDRDSAMTPKGPGGSAGLDRREALALVPVSRETEERLAVYAGLLQSWQRVKNLVGPSTLQSVWTRHIADSAQLVGLAPQARRWVDLGSGAGFPGLVIALVLHGQPGLRVDLIESNARKCAFLREVVRATGAAARVHAGRIEAVLPKLDGPIEVVTSRALAPLPDLIRISEPLLRAGALGLFLKGGDQDTAAADEARRANAGFAGGFQIDTVPSRTHPKSRIVLVRRMAGPTVADPTAV